MEDSQPTLTPLLRDIKLRPKCVCVCVSKLRSYFNATFAILMHRDIFSLAIIISGLSVVHCLKSVLK